MKPPHKTKGVSRSWGPWRARLNGKHLGYYKTKAEAEAARLAAMGGLSERVTKIMASPRRKAIWSTLTT